MCSVQRSEVEWKIFSLSLGSKAFSRQKISKAYFDFEFVALDSNVKKFPKPTLIFDFLLIWLFLGGYDRAECLKSVESYCPETNSWTRESSMGEARGRVQIAVIGETVYAVGGSNGKIFFSLWVLGSWTCILERSFRFYGIHMVHVLIEDIILQFQQHFYSNLEGPRRHSYEVIQWWDNVLGLGKSY